MKISRHRRRLTSVVLWIPVSAIVAALFLVPGDTEAAAPGSLTIQPGGNHYGGQLLTYSGDVGSGVHKIYFERRGSEGAKWARVPDPRPGAKQGEDFWIETEADGSFSVPFPSLAMDGCQIRFAGDGVETEVKPCVTVHQDVEVKGQTTAVVGVPYTLTGDTVLRPQDERPIFPGRAAELQIRDAIVPGEWATARNGTVGVDGKISFASITTNAPGTLVYRIRLADWNQGGDDVGWYPSLPFYVTVVNP